MATARVLLVALAFSLQASQVTAEQRREAVALAANPIRKVVSMLQDMQQRVTEEGKKEEEAYEKFMCYCKTGASTLDASMEEAKSKIDALTSQIKADTEKRAPQSKTWR